MATPYFPYPGIEVHTNAHGAVVLQLHHTADPNKAKGERVWVETLNRYLKPWALGQYTRMTDKSLYAQEFEIDWHAVEGSLIYHLDGEATLEKSFPIPENWTRYYALDPHPSVPHCHLWMAVDPWGDGWVYREFWPSRLYGKPGKPPQDDTRATIKQHCEVVQYMESDENPQNANGEGKRFNEKIYKRVIDYAARGFGKDNDSPDAENYQRRFELRASEVAKEKDVKFSMQFEDAHKSLESGYDTVNQWLLPREVEDAQGKWQRRSRVHIFSDRCPELIYELTHIRRKVLTAEQQERMEPDGKPVPVRKHAADDFRYICEANPVYVPPQRTGRDVAPPNAGISY